MSVKPTPIEARDQQSVADVMQHPVVTIRPFHHMMDVAEVFDQNKISSAPVVDELDTCIGVLTSSDIVRYLAEKRNFSGESLREADITLRRHDSGEIHVNVESFELVDRHMSSAVQTIGTDASVTSARTMMVHQRVHHLFVLDSLGHVVGVVSSFDLL